MKISLQTEIGMQFDHVRYCTSRSGLWEDQNIFLKSAPKYVTEIEQGIETIRAIRGEMCNIPRKKRNTFLSCHKFSY